MPLHTDARQSGESDEFDINPLYVRIAHEPLPKHSLPRESMLPGTAAQVVRDELLLDGNARLNLATFVTTWMEPEAQLLMNECLQKNMIDKDEYPQTAELESRCVNILADLWHAPMGQNATGCSTTGSSEACMLAGMALLWRWRARRTAAKTATGRRLRPGQVVASRHHRHHPRLHLPVAAELLPAHLHVRAHHEIGRGGGARTSTTAAGGGLGRPPRAPAPEQCHPGQHARLAGPGRGTAGRALAHGGVPEVGQDVHAA